MIAMQYSFTLPADYDMAIIRERVRSKGHALDQHTPLLLKAYLISSRADAAMPAQENCYAPFYLWHASEGMRDFLASPGFAGLTAAFGWPQVQIWPAMLACAMRDDLHTARWATRDIRPVAPFSNLAELAADESAACQQALAQGALLATSAYEPGHWQRVRFCLWAEPPAVEAPVWVYRVLRVSKP